MRRRFPITICIATSVVGVVAFAATRNLSTTNGEPSATTDNLRFSWVDVLLDSGEAPLAAYQLELTAAAGAFRIVGIEGGEHPAFAEPPYYDPAALAHDRVILAAFSTDANLPTGRTRVARVHVSVEGEAPKYAVKLIVSATADGSTILAIDETEPGDIP